MKMGQDLELTHGSGMPDSETMSDCHIIPYLIIKARQKGKETTLPFIES
jgi:hypothetical protein